MTFRSHKTTDKIPVWCTALLIHTKPSSNSSDEIQVSGNAATLCSLLDKTERGNIMKRKITVTLIKGVRYPIE